MKFHEIDSNGTLKWEPYKERYIKKADDGSYICKDDVALDEVFERLFELEQADSEQRLFDCGIGFSEGIKLLAKSGCNEYGEPTFIDCGRIGGFVVGRDSLDILGEPELRFITERVFKKFDEAYKNKAGVYRETESVS